MTRPRATEQAPRISLDELSALCDEMVALSRAGMPLDRGLLRVAKDLPWRLGDQAQQIALQLQAGQSLADVVSDHESPFPAVYQSVVEAGLRSGKLTVALESFARVARQISELRRLVLSALVYPLILMFLVSMIAVGILSRFGQTLPAALRDLRPRDIADGWEARLLDVTEWLSEWFWVLPWALIFFGLFWIVCTSSARVVQSKWDWVGWVPGARRLLRNSRLQTFTEVLRLLVRQRVPLDESVRLAGEASGDRSLRSDAAQLADQLKHGARDVATPKSRQAIPPLVRWSLLHSQQPGKLEATLDRATVTYRRRTEDAANWMRTFLPMTFSMGFGGVVAAMYALVIFLPWYSMLKYLSAALEAM